MENAVPGVGTVARGIRPPLTPSRRYTDTLFEPLFATYTNLPVGSTSTESGTRPAGYGEPAIGVSIPVSFSIENAQTSFDTVLGT
jgi:hypothetical protein